MTTRILTQNEIAKYTYTTGAFITPVFIDGNWRWVVTNFDNDTYCDGVLIDPVEVSDDVEGLVLEDN